MSKVQRTAWSEPAIIASLRDKFAEPAYAVLDHVRSHTGYGGNERTIDAVVMGLWPSRGVELWGIEIKSSRGDWLRELKDPAKADRLFKYFDRFFLVTGSEDVARLDEIPPPWGWMVLNAKRNFVTRKIAPLNDAVEPPSRRFLAALLRVVTERIDTTQRKRAYEAGHTKGFAEGQKRPLHGLHIDEGALADYARLKQRVAEFEHGYGVSLAYAHNPHDIGVAVRAITQGIGVPNMRRELLNAAMSAERVARVAREAAEQLPDEFKLKAEATA